MELDNFEVLTYNFWTVEYYVRHILYITQQDDNSSN